MTKLKNLAAMYITVTCSLGGFLGNQNSAIAQYYSGCFMVDGSQMLIDLNSLCSLGDRLPGKQSLLFSELQFQPSSFGNFAEVKGTVTNNSERAIPLKLIYIQVVVAK